MHSPPIPHPAILLRRLLVVALAIALAVAMFPPIAASAQPDEADLPDVAVLRIPDRDTLDQVVDMGVDLDHDVEQVGGGLEVTGIVWPEEVAALQELGVGVEVTTTGEALEQQRAELMDERAATVEEAEAAAAEAGVAAIDTVVVARADRFVSLGDQYLSVEAKSTDEQAATLTVEWDAGEGTEIGDGGSAQLGAFVDAGQYQYHRGQFNLSGVITFTIDEGSAAGSYGAVAAGFGNSIDTTGVIGHGRARE